MRPNTRRGASSRWPGGCKLPQLIPHTKRAHYAVIDRQIVLHDSFYLLVPSYGLAPELCRFASEAEIWCGFVQIHIKNL